MIQFDTFSQFTHALNPLQRFFTVAAIRQKIKELDEVDIYPQSIVGNNTYILCQGQLFEQLVNDLGIYNQH